LGVRAAAGAVEIPFPDGVRRSLKIDRVRREAGGRAAWASVIKDAGDDPDVTHGAEIAARVVVRGGELSGENKIIIRGGEGVGVVTRPGLCVAPGEAAINPVPGKMIADAMMEAVREAGQAAGRAAGGIEVTVSVTGGEAIAKKTLNGRLGIVGGISILGTTGIVRPLSAEAWTATIDASMSVGRAMGRREVVFSTGRSSERAHMARWGWPEEGYVMMGDYVEYALLAAKRSGFERVHLCSQWAKMLKVAMATPQTHVRHGAIDVKKAAAFLDALGAPGLAGKTFNTAREMYDFLAADPETAHKRVFSLLCAAARRYAESVTEGLPVRVHLVSYNGEVIATDG
jgi:cobalt-precorrin-5B (C1)-methyltransferase